MMKKEKCFNIHNKCHIYSKKHMLKRIFKIKFMTQWDWEIEKPKNKIK